ncbi:MAG: LysR family transcriptional regulator [Rhodobacteraceae bacterium]|nr:LysR family transcriptional regulator [Paracoccaceae bacterium]
MRWDNLQILLAISREGSLTRAAQFLRLDQSTAGRRLTQLEAELGAVLFVRSKSGFAPTQVGEEAIARALEVEMTINGLVDVVASTSGTAVGTVRLMGNGWTLERLARLSAAKLLSAHPQLNLRTISLLRSSHVRGEASVSLWFEKAPEDGEFSVRIGDVPYAVYQSKEVDPKDGWVSFFDEDVARREISSAQAKLQANSVVRLTGTDAGVFQGAIEAGIGKGLLPMCMAEGNPRLVRATNGPPDLMRTLWLHTHPDTVETERVKVTIDWIRDEFTRVFTP